MQSRAAANSTRAAWQLIGDSQHVAGPSATATSRGSPRRGQSRGLRRRAPCQPLPHPHPERCTPRGRCGTGRGGMPSPGVAWESSFKGRPLSLFWDGDNAARDPTGRKTRSHIPVIRRPRRGRLFNRVEYTGSLHIRIRELSVPLEDLLLDCPSRCIRASDYRAMYC